MPLVYFCSGGRAVEWRAGPPRSGRSLALRASGAPGYWNRCGVLDRFGNSAFYPGLAPARRRAPPQYGIHTPTWGCRNNSLDSALDYGGGFFVGCLLPVAATAARLSSPQPNSPPFSFLFILPPPPL